MKNYILIFGVLLLLFSCEGDSSDGTVSGSPENNSNNDGQGGSLATFALKGDYLYVVDESDLNVFSLIDEGNPVFVNTVPIGFDIETLFGFKEYLYIGSRTGMFIFSIENPEIPVELSSVSHFTACDPVIANDSLAFVTLHTNNNCGNNINLLEIYDITTITNPVLISRRNLASPKGIGLYDNFLIVCDDEIKVFDITDPVNSKLVGAINREAFDVIIRGNLLIAIGTNGLHQYDLSNNSGQFGSSHLSSIDI